MDNPEKQTTLNRTHDTEARQAIQNKNTEN